MKWTFVGASGSIPQVVKGADLKDHFAPTSCSILEVNGKKIVFDLGYSAEGYLRNSLRPGTPFDIDAFLITHRHEDHCYGLRELSTLLQYDDVLAPMLAELGPDWRFPIYAAAGVRDYLQDRSPSDLDRIFEWFEYGAEEESIGTEHEFEVHGVRAVASRTHHPVPTYAWMFEFDGVKIVHSSDTGNLWTPSNTFAEPDLAIIEATYLEPKDTYPFHLGARQAGEKAKAMGAKRLVLTHQWGAMQLEKRKEVVGLAAEAFGGPVLAAMPGMTLEVTKDRFRITPEGGRSRSNPLCVLSGQFMRLLTS